MQTKQKITASLRQSVWLKWVGRHYDAKCYVHWCQCVMTPFTFEVGHNIPESRGGATTLENLRPICSICNKSMGNRYTIDEYSRLHKPHTVTTESFLRFFRITCCATPKVKTDSS